MKIGITGRNGFIGSALAKRLSVHELYSYPRPDLDLMFHFGSPSSDIIFKQNLSWALRETIESFLTMVEFCKKHSIKLIYPSSANVYQKTTVYSHGKAALEEIQAAYGGDILGLRIFCGYGVGEEHKGEYSSIVYQFVQQMKQGKSPLIYGDGKQTRDFIYIDDIVEAIVDNSESTGTIDIGTGKNTSFNEVVKMINEELHTDIEPTYVGKPEKYVDETPCKNPINYEVSLKEGIHRLCTR